MISLVQFLTANWTWAVAALAIAGVVLNIYKRPACFAVWIFTNAVWAVYDFRLGLYSQAAIFAVYFILAVWGLAHWLRAGKDN